MTEVWFETAALAEVIKKVATIAPLTGRESDLYKGVFMQVRRGEVFFNATNGEVFYTERLVPSKVEGADIDWRMSSKLLNDIVSTLPIKPGSQSKFASKDKGVALTSGRMRASLPLMRAEDYPTWDIFDPEQYPVIEDFAKNLEAVSWATSKEKLPPLAGVYIDNEYMAATDRSKLSVMPVTMDLGDRGNIVVPIGLLNQVLRGMEEVKLGFEENFLQISPYEDMWVKCVLFDDTYPDFRRMLSTPNDQVCMLNRNEITEVVERVSKIGSGDRQVHLQVNLGDNMIDFHIKDSQTPEAIWESVWLGTQCDHPVVEYIFDPGHFADVFRRTRNQEVMMMYNLESQLKPVKFQGADGYSVVLGPRRKVQNG